MTPEESGPVDTDQKPRNRRSVRLATQADSRPEPITAPPSRPVTYYSSRPDVLRDRVLRLAELVVGDWAPTLREALVRVLVFAVVLVALGVAFGAEVAAAGAAVGVLMFLVGRRRAGSPD
jgi:hypothetical protein